MKRAVVIILLAAATGCTKNPSTPAAAPLKQAEPRAARRSDMDDYFVSWLKAHGHKDVVVDAEGVGLAGNATRLRAGLYGSNHHDQQGFVVEVEFSVALPSHQEIVEYVAGTGETEDKAINDALVNFTLTTFHVVHRAFIDFNDPHMTSSTIKINGEDRELIAGDILMRGQADGKNVDLNGMRAEINRVLAKAPIGRGSHWIKIVYCNMNGEPGTVSATLDNAEDQSMTDAVRNLNWPRQKEFYMAKQFIVIK